MVTVDQYKVAVKVIFVDFSGGAEIYDKMRMELSGLEIGILINNIVPSVTYLSHIFSATGMSPDPEKVSAVHNWPESVTQVISLMFQLTHCGN